ncbi:Hint domain-containing protein [Roseovarius sp. 2305UL8-3]|uniref:Hint domain-containing protein n=1 Tax=Roseovarius conchicola TaxID=3121636 RepID=UPI003528B052
MVSGLGGPAGFGENVYSTSPKAAGGVDDGSVEIDVTSVFGPGGINFFGTNYTEIYLNSNGTISFGTPFTDFNTTDLTAETTPMLAPFFADVNVASGGEIYWDIDPVAGTIIMTWDSVAPFSGSGTNSFQVVLTDNGGGDFTVEYIYEDIQWSGSAGGDVADVGWTDGGANDQLLDGSGDATELLNYETNDFGNSDPNGTFEIDFAGGVPQFPDGLVEGSDGNDTIDGSFGGDPEGDVIDGGDGTGVGGNADEVYGGEGDDSIASGLADDTVVGGGGDDTIEGGDGNDSLAGDNNGVTSTSESLNWSAAGADEADISAGFTQDTGGMEVSVSFSDDGDNNATFTVESSDTQFVPVGEPFSTTSSVALFGDGDAATSTTTIAFSGSVDSGLEDEVENVSFAINDVDSFAGNHIDTVTVLAFDADGNPVTVTLTPQGDDTVSGDTITAGGALDDPNDANGSVLVEIAGPVSEIQIIYTNGLTGTHAINITDIHFDTIPTAAGNDSIDGGAGNDTLLGEDGDDTLIGGTGDDSMEGGAGDDLFTVAEGDTALGGDGSDTFVLTDLGETGSGTINITGGEGGTDVDTLQLTPDVTLADITFTDTNPDDLAGFFTLADGTVVTFDEIENIICFTPGTMILTETGERPIDTLRIGDRVITRDHGAQPLRWIGQSHVRGDGRFAPVEVAPHMLPGAKRSLLVSPQHRFVFGGYQSELYFGDPEVMAAATHLEDGINVWRSPRALVTYIHLVFDAHEVIFAEGAATESFHVGTMGLSAITGAVRKDLFHHMPHLRADPTTHGPTARRILKAHEARLLIPAPQDIAQAA